MLIIRTLSESTSRAKAFAPDADKVETMISSVDPLSQVLAALEMLEGVQKAASQQQVSQSVRLARAAHQPAPTVDGKGQHVNVIV